MIARVVGSNQGQLPPTSPFTLSSVGGERERESQVYSIFFLHSTPQHKQQNSEFSVAVVIFLLSACLFIIYTTTMNIMCSLLVYSHVQSENECKTKQYSGHEPAVVGADPTLYIHINYSNKQLRDAIYRLNCVVKTS